MRYDDIFVPNDQPLHTYVERDNKKLESDLSDYIDQRNIVVSISGPSKTGKTVLFRKVIDEDRIIPVPGVSIKSEFDFWSVIFSFIGEPIGIVQSSNRGIGGEVLTEGEASASVIVAKGKGRIGSRGLVNSSQGREETLPFNPFQQIIREIGGSDYVVFIDDFHYIDRETQPQIARIIKGLSENGVKICTASVPHRSDDVVRANPELRGRLASIDVDSWSEQELTLIGQKGFPLLNIDLSPSVVRGLAEAAFGSPQLMQAQCMNLCRNLGVREPQEQLGRIDVTDDQISNTMEDTSNFANFRALLAALHTGPKKHGKDRKIFEFTDGSRGDVYRATLLAIADGDAKREFNYDELMTRVRRICSNDAPVGSALQNTLSHMSAIAQDMATSPILEWDEDVLTITDPYFAYYLRSSRQLQKLERKDQ